MISGFNINILIWTTGILRSCDCFSYK